MSENLGTPTSAGATQESGTTGLTDGPGDDGRDRERLHGGTGVPPDASATADADHPGLGAGGDPGDTTSAGGSLAGNPQIRAEEEQA